MAYKRRTKKTLFAKTSGSKRAFLFVVLFALVGSYFIFKSLAASATSAIDINTCTSITGWTFDKDKPSYSIAVNIYITQSDSPQAGRDFGASVKTAALREDVNKAYKITGSHGFNYDIPAQFRNSQKYNVFIFAIGVDATGKADGDNPLIGKTTWNCGPSTTAKALGNVDALDCNRIAGWAIDTDKRDGSINVHIYIGGPAGSGSYAANIITGSMRADVNNVYSVTGSHGFDFAVPAQFRDGKSYPIYVYAIGINSNNTADGYNPLIGSGTCKYNQSTNTPTSPTPAPTPIPKPTPPPANQPTVSKVACAGSGVDGARVQIVYARSAQQADKSAEYRQYFQARAAQMNAVVETSAKKTAGVRRIRFVHDANCVPVVSNVVISKEPASGLGLNGLFNELMSKGLNDNNRKYVVFVDSSYKEQLWCGIGGSANDSNDPSTGWSKDSARNNNERFFGYALLAKMCWGKVKAVGDLATGDAALHELFHAFGAVSDKAPHHTTAGHCTDDQDIMCYKDADQTKLNSQICPNLSSNNILDCGNDDYFSTSPPPGSYLGQYWNSADSRWLLRE